MTAQQLRNSILQQAIQGRLVPQDPDDEPASVLLERIRKEKEQLVKEGKLKKKDLVVTPIADDEIPFDIPSGWEWCRIGDLGITNTGSTPSKTNPSFYGSYIPFVSPGDIQNNKLSYRKDGLSELGYQVARPTPAGTILQVCIGGSIGKCAICDREITFNQQINSITPNIVDSNYIHAVLSSNYIISIMKDTTTGSATPIINKSTWENLPIPLPPLAEQRRIVAKIEELMPLVEKYGKAQTELDTLNQDLPRRLRQSVLQQAIQGKLVEQDEKDEWSNIFVSKLPKKKYKTNAEWPCEEPFDLPSGWNWCHIGDVCEILNGYAFKSGNYVDSGIRIMRISNVQAGVIVDKDPKFYPLSSEADIKDYVLKEGDMLMSLTGNVGRVGILKADMLPAALNQRVACLRLHNEEIKPFFYHYLQSEIFRMRCESSGHGMAQLNISTEWLKQELIPLPPLAEQRRIVAKIEKLFAEIDKLK